jgi:L-seryl-tRNA(Ser) seleniumtransferase
MADDRLRALPSIETLVEAALSDGSVQTVPRRLLVEAARQVLATERAAIEANPDGRSIDPAAHASAVRARAIALAQPVQDRVLNATGVVLHTNLGRAPMSEPARRAIERAAGGYVSLEYDVGEGRRSERGLGVEAWLRRLTGAEAALVVNNGAAAVLLVVSALAQGRKVLVSRGELVEIGGSFRLPEILRKAGATLVEVGTTNRTRADDYRRALTPETAPV